MDFCSIKSPKSRDSQKTIELGFRVYPLILSDVISTVLEMNLVILSANHRLVFLDSIYIGETLYYRLSDVLILQAISCYAFEHAQALTGFSNPKQVLSRCPSFQSVSCFLLVDTSRLSSCLKCMVNYTCIRGLTLD